MDFKLKALAAMAGSDAPSPGLLGQKHQRCVFSPKQEAPDGQDLTRRLRFAMEHIDGDYLTSFHPPRFNAQAGDDEGDVNRIDAPLLSSAKRRKIMPSAVQHHIDNEALRSIEASLTPQTAFEASIIWTPY